MSAEISQDHLLKLVIRAAWVILFLNIADIGLTFACLAKGADELNPIADFLLKYHLIIPAKMGVCALILWSAYKSGYERLPLRLCALWTIVGVYALVVVLNTHTLTTL